MFIILGATGHVGSATADVLLEAGEPVTVVTRSEDKAAQWRARGAEAAVVDVCDTPALKALFGPGRRAFLLNPPAAPDSDTDAREHATLAAIMAAIDGSGLDKVVLESTYGAQPGDAIGDLSVLYDFERALAAQPIPHAIQRAAFYMSNWAMYFDAAKAGMIETVYPEDFAMPMVAPADLGQNAARLLREPPGAPVLDWVEGPARYTSRDVADAFARALGTPVALTVISRDRWEASYRNLGFSPEAAAAYTRMAEMTVGQPAWPEDPVRGTTTLDDYLAALVNG